MLVTGSEVERWGLGVVQEIDSAAMHVWLRWQHQTLDLTSTSWIRTVCQAASIAKPPSFDDWDLFQAGGVIFF